MTVYIEKGITYKLNKCDDVTIFDFIHVYFCEVTDSNTNHFGSISDKLGQLAALSLVPFCHPIMLLRYADNPIVNII